MTIFIITSNFKIADQIDALHNGADAYTPWQENAQDNILLALATIARYNDQSKRLKMLPKVIAFDNVLLSPGHRQAFVDG